MPAAWTAGKGFPVDLRVEVSTSSWGTTYTTVVEAGGDAAGTVVRETKNDSGRLECRYTIGRADLAQFGWSELMALMEQRRRDGVSPAGPVPEDAPQQSVSLRAFGVAASEILREYDVLDEVNRRAGAVAKGAAHWHSRAIRERLADLTGVLEHCYVGDLPERGDPERLRAYNVRMRAQPLEAQIEIDAGLGRARVLRIDAGKELEEERRCMEDAIDRVRLPIPGIPTCNPIWTLLVRPRSPAPLPNPYDNR